MSLFKADSFENPKLRLRFLLLGLLICISIPLIFLVVRAYTQFQWEMYYHYRWTAQHMVKEFTKVIDIRLTEEGKRPFADYQFYKVSSNPLLKKKGVTLSPLSSLPDEMSFPGLLGYFQIDDEGTVSCPILPFRDKDKLASAGLDLEWDEIDKRLKLQKKINLVLINYGLIEEPEEGRSDSNTIPISSDEETPDDESSRTESNWVSRQNSADQFIKNADKQDGGKREKENKDEIFVEDKVEIGHFKAIGTNDGHFLFIRKVWKGERKIIQGFVVSEKGFLEDTLSDMFVSMDFESPVMVQIRRPEKPTTSLVSTFEQGKSRIEVIRADVDQFAEGFYYSALQYPLKDITLKFSTNKIPMGPASAMVIYLLGAVIIIVFIGLWVIYRLGLRQILMNEERLNFVSAVSHELKTPLTSIIMYSDMLREGMVIDESKKKIYYDFIFFESERLGRLIENVLRLSKLSRHNQGIQLEYTTVDCAVDLIRSKVSTLIENNNIDFRIHVDKVACSGIEILIDHDAFSQIVINLIDNAIKFSSKQNEDESIKRVVEVNFNRDVAVGSGNSDLMCFSVRDYGPGVDSANSARIFDLFYRAGNEMTRTTPGTGIGLALVSELTAAMGGKVKLISRNPGAEFCICLQFRK